MQPQCGGIDASRARGSKKKGEKNAYLELRKKKKKMTLGG